MTKLSSKLNLTKLFYISPQQDLYSPQKWLSYFPKAQETIIIIDLTRKDLKNKLSYSQKAQETITIIGPARIILKNKLSYSQ